MHISRVGGVIAAASKKDAVPLLQVGSISIIKRTVISFQQAGVFPIVIVTGIDEEEVKYQLAPFGVVFIRNESCECPQLFDSVRIGLRYLQNKCDKVVFTPVNVPMFTPGTLKKLIGSASGIATPFYRGRGGHPVVVSNGLIGRILSYRGEDGLRGAIRELEDRRVRVEVEDEGVTVSIHDAVQLQARLDAHNRAILNAIVKVSIEKEAVFFDARARLLLYLIADAGSVRKACGLMALSCGKAWNILNRLEQELGYAVVERKQGGSRGGNTRLTERGAAFLTAYQEFEDSVLHHAQREFERLFEARGLV